MRVLLLSDVHADGPGCPRQAALLAFLAREQADVLVLGGDIFQRWWHREEAFFPSYAPVVEALRRFPRVIAVGGNHDFRFPTWWVRHGGGEGGRTYAFAWEGWRVRVEHGDAVDRSPGYRALATVLRSRAASAALDRVALDRLWAWVGRALHEPHGDGNAGLLDLQRVWASGVVTGGEADIVVTGHVHVPVLERVRDASGARSGLWLNTGDFVQHFSYGELIDGEVRSWAWSPSGDPVLRASLRLAP